MTPTGVEHLDLACGARMTAVCDPSMTPTGVEHDTFAGPVRLTHQVRFLR